MPAPVNAQECTTSEEVCADIRAAKKYNDSGEPKVALKHLRDAQKRKSFDEQWLVYFLGQKATAYAQQGKNDEALAAVSSALAFRPNDLWLLLQSCRQHALSDFLAKAQRDCARVRTLLRRSRDTADQEAVLPYLLAAEASLALEMNFPSAALERLDQLNGSPIPKRFLDDERARALSMMGEHEAAAESLDLVIAAGEGESASTLANLYRRRGFEHLAAGETEAGLLDLEQAVNTVQGISSENPNRDRELARHLYGICAVQLRLNNTAAALDWCRALSETEFSTTSHVLLDAIGLAQYHNELYIDAAQSFSQALQLFPSGTQSYHNLIQTLRSAEAVGLVLDYDDYVADTVRVRQNR